MMKHFLKLYWKIPILMMGWIFFTSSFNVVAQNFKVSGTITDETGAPLPFVTVVEKGSTTGTVSGEDGKYAINLSGPDATLVFSYVGYLSEEVPVDGRNEIDMNLIPDLQQLDEVIVVGYGTQKKSDLTGAMVSVDSEDLENDRSMSIEQALQGKAAGVEILNNTGAPGSRMTVRIRGMGTLNSGTSPLYVVDGFIMGDQGFGKEGGNVPDNKMGIEFLDPSEIESIEILKDASAAAIYGSRGANGVVLITTKKGKVGKKSLEFNAYYGIQSSPRERWLDLMDGTQFRDYTVASYQQRWGDDWIFMATNDNSPLGIQRFVNPSGEKLPVDNFNWQDAIFDEATIQSYRLSSSGGNESSTYNLSGSYFTQDGLIGNSGIERINVRFGGTHNIAENIKVGTNMIGSRSFRERTNEGGYGGTNVIAGAWYADPTLTPKDENGDWNYTSYTRETSNPVYAMVRDEYTYDSYRYFGTGFLDIDILPSLKFHSTIGLDITYGMMESFDPKYYLDPLAKRDNHAYRHREERWINFDTENTLTYSKQLGRHSITTMAGYTWQNEKYRDWRLFDTDFPSEEERMRYPNITNLETLNHISSDPMEYAIESMLGRLTYSYADKILFTGSIRRDASSKFGPENRVGYFPSFAAGYKLSQEQFIQNIPFISFLKVRGGWGILGNQGIPPYQSTQGIDRNQTWVFGLDDQVYAGSFPNRVANPAVQWEETEQINVGIDLNMFENKLSLTVDRYWKNTTDLLIRVPVPSYLGYHNLERVGGAPPLGYSNAAEMRNDGFEAVMGYKVVTGDFSIRFNANFSHVGNEVISLGNGRPIRTNGLSYPNEEASITQEGEPLAGFYGYVVDGIYQDYDDIANSPWQGAVDPHVNDRDVEPNPVNYIAPGDFKFKDIDGNDTINSFDRTYIGSPLADFTYGFGFEAAYKGWDLYVQTVGTYGNDIVNPIKYFLYGYTSSNKAADLAGNYWTTENPDAEYPRIAIDKNQNMRFSDFYVEDGSFLRIRNITLGYTVPESLTSRINTQRIRAYITIQNLYTFTKYSGMEPEIGTTVGWNPRPLDIGVDRATYPQPRTFMLGLNLSF